MKEIEDKVAGADTSVPLKGVTSTTSKTRGGGGQRGGGGGGGGRGGGGGGGAYPCRNRYIEASTKSRLKIQSNGSIYTQILSTCFSE